MAPVALAPTAELTESTVLKGASQFHHTVAQPLAVSASSLNFTLAGGQVILDAVSGGAAVACLGSDNLEIVEAMTKQATSMPYVYHQVLGNSPGEDLADWLIERSKGTFVAGAFLNSGSEAMEACLKLIRQFWVEEGESQRKYIIARNPSYHGNTLGVLGLGNVKPRRDIYMPFIPEVFQHVTSPNYKRYHKDGESEEQYSQRLAEELEAKIVELGPSNVAAFVAEPVVGSALGVMPPPQGYFPAIEAVTRKYGILLVMDEVMTGTGRLGTLFAHTAVAEGVKPDMISLAKGLGAGYVTISGVLVGSRVASRVRTAGQWKNSHTYQNHPINCAVALKIMELMERDSLFDNVVARGEQLLRELRVEFAHDKIVYDIRGRGLFVGVEFDLPSSLKPRFAARVKAQSLKNGLLTLGISGTIDGVEGESIILAPAYTVTKSQVTTIVRILAQSVRECVEDF